ncbi:MAG: helix-turn-helix domain-containing protein [Pyrinomonadaceae bacterium]
MNSKSSDQHSDGRAGGDSLGGRLRAAREARNLSLREVSDQTRITRRHLEAIEADDYRQLPGGIFNRSFVKAFAKAVGYDEDEAVRAYQQVVREHGESFDDLPTTRQASRIYTDDAPARSPLLTGLLSLAILAIISLAAYAGLHYYRRTEQAATPPAPTNAANNHAVPATNANQPTTAAATPAPAGLKIGLRAKGEDVWLRTSADDAPSSDGILKAEQSKEISAEQSLKLEYARVKASALEVTINGRPAVVPAEAKPGKSLVELLITKDDYEKLLQHP